jgi:hypothetical protein
MTELCNITVENQRREGNDSGPYWHTPLQNQKLGRNNYQEVPQLSAYRELNYSGPKMWADTDYGGCMELDVLT